MDVSGPTAGYLKGTAAALVHNIRSIFEFCLFSMDTLMTLLFRNCEFLIGITIVAHFLVEVI